MRDHTVFIVDDDNSVLCSLKWFFTSMNFAVEIYSSASDFLKSYDPHIQGCIISDVRMPGMNGFQLLSKLKSANSPLKIIFMTGFGDIPMAIRAIKAGATDFVTKPLHKECLLDLIQKCIKNSSHCCTDKEEVLTEKELQVLKSLWKEN